jgi:hypothetical protein
MALVTSAAASLKNTWGFSPQSIPGLALWLDGADTGSMVFSSGTTISTWKDKSGLGNNAGVFGTPTLTANSINGVQAIATLSGSFFNGNISITGTTLTCFAVAMTTTPLPTPVFDQRLVSLTNGTNFDFNRVDSAIGLFNQGNITSTIATYRNGVAAAAATITQNVPFQAVSEYDGTSGFLWENGTAGSPASTGSTGSFAITKYGVGNDAGFTSSPECWIGFIGEVIIFTGALSTTQRQQVEGYLAKKWGLQANLPGAQPYKTIPPFNRAFKPTDIANCALWLDGADVTSIVLSGSSVTQWNDKSSGGQTMIPFLGTITQTTLNGNNAMNFGGSIMTTPTSSSFFWASSFTQLYVANVATGGIIIDTVNTALGAYGIYTFTANGALMNINNSTTNVGTLQVFDSVAGPVPPTNAWFIFSIGYGSTGNAATNYTLNGTVRSTNVLSGTGGAVVNPSLRLLINGVWGTGSGSSLGTGIKIAEVIHFNSNIDTPTRQQVESYLAWKWGLVGNLPAGHPGKLLPPFSVAN